MLLRLPELSEASQEAVITAWHARENESVEKGKDLLEISTDKATFDLASPATGVLSEVHKSEGEKASPGEVIAEIREEQE